MAIKKAIAKKPAAKKPAAKKPAAKKPAAKKPAYKKNPVAISKAKKQQMAVELWESFTGEPAEFFDSVDVDWPEVGVKVGDLVGIAYKCRRDGKMETYYHEFKPSARPVLIAGHDGKNLAIILGDYRFTDRGIVDGGK